LLKFFSTPFNFNCKSNLNMKKIILLSALFIASFSAQAQIADGSIAPDFTATDINGVTHNLYDLLDEGKTVILDVMATWCPPCWTYQNTGALEDLYECYGEPGSDNVVVFMIEGDPSTPESALYGSGNTMGDWVTGTPYPIIESAAIANSYQISFYPTVYRICPGDKTVFQLGQVGATAAKNAVLNQTCTPPVRMDDPALICSNAGGDACAGFETALFVNLFNSGANPLTSATIQAFVNGNEVASTDWTGNIGLYQEETAAVGTAILSGSAVVEFVVTNANDEKMDNNGAEAFFETAPVFGVVDGMETFTVEIRTDSYGAETYWALMTDQGEIVAEGGNTDVGLTNIGNGGGSAPANANAYGNATIYTEEVTISGGCYSFVITDFFGDGMCCTFGSGYYKLKDSEGTIVIEGDQYEEREDNPFSKTSSVANEEVLLANNFEVYPNPVQDNLTVNFSLIETAQVDIEIINAIGQVVYLEQAGKLLSGEYNVNVSMNRFQAGLYFVNLVTEYGITTRRVIKQ
jgi:thiol-disulfide isomerase/thioredoxin